MCDRTPRITATAPKCLRCCPPCCNPCLCCPPACCEPCTAYCFFDLESAVFDTRHIYQRACRELLASYNTTLPEEVLMRCGPMETHEMAQLICRKCELPVLWENFLVQLNEHTCELIANPPLMQGVERLVKHLYDNCIGLALITSSTRALYCKKIRGREEFFAMFNVVLCSDEYNRPKPEPDCYLIAMSLLCDPPCVECCLAFDGTTKGVQAAREAHLQVIMLPDPDLPCCWSELATKRLETLVDFDPEEFGMPYLEPLPEPPPVPSARASAEDQGPIVLKSEEEIITSGQDDEEPPETNVEEPPTEPA
ncbi:probable pseudouridine-5'-phosphatase [Drosophila novamexicana]|uniref:probable pseudouridine-5'-phosphatase n=1 Tax=Drosophila novamexicana TaxID=47314 RepID=UPI0011E5FBEE|nr:probable pseudouridine-5'-phosphatase [Drosophila novamexicana]